MRDRLKGIGALALRWGLDAVRGYTRIADGLEGFRSCLAIGRDGDARTKQQYADCALDCLRILGELRALSGGMGAGARLALSPAEWSALRLEAEELRAEALAQPGEERGQA